MESQSPVIVPTARSLTELAEIARRHSGTAGLDRLLPEIVDQRTGLRIVEGPEYEVWVLRWPAGTSVTPHDHGGSRGAFTVVSGVLDEVRWPKGEPTTRRVGRGEVVTVEAGVVHDVIARSGLAMSVHAYSPPLTAMGFYDEGAKVRVDAARVDDASEFRSDLAPEDTGAEIGSLGHHLL